mgnify:CR=1 FL=1
MGDIIDDIVDVITKPIDWIGDAIGDIGDRVTMTCYVHIYM